MDCRKIRSARGGADHLERSLLFEVSRREGISELLRSSRSGRRRHVGQGERLPPARPSLTCRTLPRPSGTVETGLAVWPPHDGGSDLPACSARQHRRLCRRSLALPRSLTSACKPSRVFCSERRRSRFSVYNWLQPGPVVPIAPCRILLAIAFCSRLERHTRSVVTFGLAAAAPAHPLLLIGPSLTNSRVLYLGTLGGAILVAALLTRLASRQIRNVATASVVILFVLGVGNNITAWRYASDLSTQFLEELQALEPAPAENTQSSFRSP